MFLTTLPFDYAALLDPGDRVRTPAPSQSARLRQRATTRRNR
jgi:hypothetical protein